MWAKLCAREGNSPDPKASTYNTWKQDEGTSLYSWSKYYSTPDVTYLTSPYFNKHIYFL